MSNPTTNDTAERTHRRATLKEFFKNYDQQQRHTLPNIRDPTDLNAAYTILTLLDIHKWQLHTISQIEGLLDANTTWLLDRDADTLLLSKPKTPTPLPVPKPTTPFPVRPDTP